MKSALAILPLLSLGAQAPPASVPGPRPVSCADLSLPSFPVCRLTGRGVIFAATEEEADGAAAAANQGEASFTRHVGPVSRYAVLVGADIREAQRRLREAGYWVVLPWLNPAARQRGAEESVRRGTEARLRAQGLSQAQIDAAVAQGLAQVRAGRDRLLVSYSAVAHELGHLWLIESFWRRDIQSGAGNAGHYGGPGPDWLDEAVAIAMEEERLTAPRRIRFRELVRGEAPGRVETLAAFFAMDHPLKGVGALVRSGQLGATQGGAAVLTGPEVFDRLGVRPEAAPNFYAQARAVADFLLERSGNPRVLGDIARALAGGRSMEQWLAADGRRQRLGGTMAELEGTWRAWAATAYAGSGSGGMARPIEARRQR